jgi:AraC-like DNA-binding protein
MRWRSLCCPRVAAAAHASTRAVAVGVGDVRPATVSERRRLYLLARATVARHYRRELTLRALARTLASSPRQLQRAYAQFGRTTFREDLFARRMAAAAELLLEQRSLPVREVALLVGYRQASHFARAFRRRYGLSPARFRDRAASVRSGGAGRTPPPFARDRQAALGRDATRL